MERPEESVEYLLNKIKMLSLALSYYENKKIYSGNIEKIEILKDRGHVARSALNQIKDIDKYNDELIDNMKAAIADSEFDINSINVDNLEEFKEKIKILKNIQ